MPEHFHLLIVPSSGTKISWIMQEIKKGSARLINKDRFCRAQGRARLPNETPFLKNQGTLGRPWHRRITPPGIRGRPFGWAHDEALTPNNNPTRYSGSSLTPTPLLLSFPCRWGAKKSQKEISEKPFSCHPEFILWSRNSLILWDAEPILNRVQHKVQHDIWGNFITFSEITKKILKKYLTSFLRSGIELKNSNFIVLILHKFKKKEVNRLGV